jgi:hypothetical protein
MTSKMFVRRSPTNCASDGTYDVPFRVHPWIRDNLNPLRNNLVPNKDRPRLFTLDDNQALACLETADPNTYQENDLVWVSFRAHYSIRPKQWSLEFTPLEMVRIGHGSGPGDVDVGDADFSPLEVGTSVQLKVSDSKNNEDHPGESDRDASQSGSPVRPALKRKVAADFIKDEEGDSDSKVPRSMDIDAEDVPIKATDVPMESVETKVLRGRKVASSKR